MWCRQDIFNINWLKAGIPAISCLITAFNSSGIAIFWVICFDASMDRDYNNKTGQPAPNEYFLYAAGMPFQ